MPFGAELLWLGEVRGVSLLPWLQVPPPPCTSRERTGPGRTVTRREPLTTSPSTRRTPGSLAARCSAGTPTNRPHRAGSASTPPLGPLGPGGPRAASPPTRTPAQAVF